MNYNIEGEQLRVVVSDYGAQLQSIKKGNIEYLWQGDPDIWPDRALTLFPYIARLTDGKYQYQGKEYELPIHGFAPTAVFNTIQEKPDELVMYLTDTDEFLKVYPFRFCFRVIFRIEANKLSVTYQVENRDNKTMYFGVGGHPGFNVPLSDGEAFEEYRLHFQNKCSPERVLTTDRVLWSGKMSPYPLENGTDIPLTHSLFDDDAIILKGMDHTISLQDKTGADRIIMEFPGFSILGIWHMPKMQAPYVCLEPWTSLFSRDGIIEDLEKQPDLISLAPGEHCEKTYTMTFQ